MDKSATRKKEASTMAVERAQTVVVGAGVVGLAVARTLAKSGRQVLVLERERMIGTATSSRNSEVIHGGIYYAANSIKAKTCVNGRRALYAYCDRHNVPYRRCGKLIVATCSEDLAVLEQIQARAYANGMTGDSEALRRLEPEEVAELEPEVSCLGALLSPATGVLDSHAFMQALQGEAEANGATFAFETEVLGGAADSSGRVRLQTADLELDCDEVVNVCGHGAPGLSSRINGVPAGATPAAFFAKGNYFGLEGRSPFGRLIYPVPQQAGLGVHATIDLSGRCRFGPDVEWVDAAPDGSLDFTVDPRRADSFYGEVRKYWPRLPDGALVPDYAGVRPKIQAPGQAASDFALVGPTEHGVRGLVSLFGIESPGLTASLALAQEVLNILGCGHPRC